MRRPFAQASAQPMPVRPPVPLEFSPEYPYPQEETPLTKWCARVACVALAVMFWIGFIKLPLVPLSTWRFMNMVMVLACIPFYKNLRYLKEMKILVVLQIIMLAGLMLRALIGLQNEGRILIEISQIIAVMFAFAIAPATACLWLYNSRRVMNTVTVSILISAGYQLFQLLTYYATGRGEFWPMLLIEPPNAIGNFFRIVGPFYGASGLTQESGHLALTIGPQLCLLMIVWHYRRLINKRPGLIMACMVWALLMTLSMGGFMQIAFVLFTYIFLANSQGEVPVRAIKVVLIGAGVGMVLYLINPTFIMSIYGHISGRISEMMAGTAGRQISGSDYLWEIFWDHPWLGIGLSMTFDELGADPNVLVPLTYVTHGAILATVVFGVYFIPIIRVVFVYKKPLFVIPMIALGLHAAMAYGTYRWPFMWVTYTLSICYASTFWMSPPMANVAPMEDEPRIPPPGNLPLRTAESGKNMGHSRFDKH